MASGFLSSLYISLRADTGTFETDMGRAARIAQQRSEAIKHSVQSAMHGVAGSLAGVLSIGALAGFMKQTIDLGDSLGQLSEKTGVGVGALSVFKLEADRTGTSMDTLGGGMTKFAKTVAQAAAGSKEQAEAFKQMGIGLTGSGGKLKSTQALFTEVAGKMGGYKDSLNKTALAQALFGRSGADLIPVLNRLGQDGFDKAKGDAQALGTYMDEGMRDAAQRLKVSMAELHAASQGLGLTIASKLVPALATEAETLVGVIRGWNDYSDKAQGAQTASQNTGGVVAWLARGFALLETGIKDATATLAYFGQVGESMAQNSAMGKLLQGDFKGAFKAGINPFSQLSAGIKTAQQNWGALKDTIADNQKELVDRWLKIDDAAKNAAKAGAAVAAATGDAPSGIAKAAKAATTNLQALAGAYQHIIDLAAKASETDRGPSGQLYAQYTDTVRQLTKAFDDYIAKGGKASAVQAFFDQGIAGANDKLQHGLAALKLQSTQYADALKDENAARKAQLDLQVASIGMGAREAEQASALLQIQQQSARAIAEIVRQRDATLALNPNADTSAFDAQIKAQKDSLATQLGMQRDFYDQSTAMRENWQAGIKGAMANFVDNAKNYAQQAHDFMDQLTSGFADAFTQFGSSAESAKKAFGDWIDSMFAQALKFVANQSIMKLFESLGSGGSGSASGGGGWAGLFGSLASAFGGGRASGGLVAAGGLYRVNEHGPEMLRVGNDDFLMMGARSGNVTPHEQVRGGGGITLNQYIQPTSTRRTADQIATATARKLRLAAARNG